MIHVKVPGGAGIRYPVMVESGILGRAGRLIAALKPSRICVISNALVWSHWGEIFQKGLGKQTATVIEIPDGEKFKTLPTVHTILDELQRVRADRSTLIVGVGGGVVGDIAGFVAAIYLRGVDCVQIPTTLLAQVDSSIGGKTGVNLTAGKNLVGAFHHPKMVLADPRVLSTLSEREFHAGLFEAIKTGVIRDKSLFDFMDNKRAEVLGRNPRALKRIIEDCLRIKAQVVGADERETGVRRILNFGHTVGHALEAETQYTHFLHGEAVAWGMRAATRIASELRLLRDPDAARIHEVIAAYGPVPALPELDPMNISARLLADKKTRKGVVHFVLPRRIGKVDVVPGVSTDVVESAVRWLAAA